MKTTSTPPPTSPLPLPTPPSTTDGLEGSGRGRERGVVEDEVVDTISIKMDYDVNGISCARMLEKAPRVDAFETLPVPIP